MAYDPSGDIVRYTDISYSSLCIGPLPKTVDFQQMIRAETVRDRERLRTQVRQRRLSDSMVRFFTNNYCISLNVWLSIQNVKCSSFLSAFSLYSHFLFKV